MLDAANARNRSSTRSHESKQKKGRPVARSCGTVLKLAHLSFALNTLATLAASPSRSRLLEFNRLPLFCQLESLELPLARFCLTKADKSTRSLIELSEEDEEAADSISFLSTLLSLLSLHSNQPDNRLNRLQICNCNWAHSESQTFAALVSAAAAKQQKEKSAVHSGCSCCSSSSSSALVSVIKSPLVPFNYIGRLGGWLREGKQQQPPHHFRLLLLLLLLISAIRADFDNGDAMQPELPNVLMCSELDQQQLVQQYTVIIVGSFFLFWLLWFIVSVSFYLFQWKAWHLTSKVIDAPVW